VHDFGSGVISNIIEVGSGPLFLHWADPSNIDSQVATDDYDLFLFDGDLRNVQVASTDIQSVASPGFPFEFLGFNIPAGFRVVVAKKGGSRDLPIRVQLSRGELAIGTPGASWGHNSARGAVGVAAVDVAEAAGGVFTGGPTTQAELFTSDGNRFIYFDRNNNPIPGGPEPRLQPSMAAPDGVSTTLPSGSGLNPFFGTSAAAPTPRPLRRCSSPRSRTSPTRTSPPSWPAPRPTSWPPDMTGTAAGASSTPSTR